MFFCFSFYPFHADMRFFAFILIFPFPASSSLVLFCVLTYNDRMDRMIVLDGKTIPYILERKRVKNVNLRIRSGSVFISAPHWIPLPVIEQFLRDRSDYVLSALERTRKIPFPPCTEGESILYLGCPHTLSLESASKASVICQPCTIRVSLRTPENGESVRLSLEKWYRSESERICRTYLDKLFPFYAQQGVSFPEIRMRAMRSCWGCCHPSKRVITFNARLAAVPEECIEYVVAHELTHFLHADHSPAFYSALEPVIPDWKMRRKKLRQYSSLLND